MAMFLQIFAALSLLILVEARIYPYVSQYNWHPPPPSYNSEAVPPPCSTQEATPCPGASGASPTPTNTPTTSASASDTTAVSTAATSTSTQGLQDCITDGGGICTAFCNIGTFTEQNSTYSCEGNGIGSVCCLEPLS